MRVRMVLAVLFLAGVGAAPAGALSNITLSGSQVLFDTTNEVLSFCPGATGLTYVGMGSAIGEITMIAGRQSVAPMTAFLGSAVCSTPAATQQQAQGLVIGLDGITILGAPTTAGAPACNGAIADCDPTTDPTAGIAFDTTIATPSGPYTFNSWRDVLRVLFAGFTHDIIGVGPAQWAARDCNSAIRQTLANSYGNFFENNCAAQAGDATGGVCTQIRHIFRRDDFSGASDTVVSLLGLPSIVAAETTVTVFPGGVQTSLLQHTGASPFCNSVRPAFVFPQSASNPAPTCLAGSDSTWDPTSANAGPGFCQPVCGAGLACVNGACVAAPPACSPACAAGQVCSGGACIARSACVPPACCPETSVYRATMQDNDPIRRTCAGAGNVPTSPAEDVCSNSGDLGLMLPMNDVPENGGTNGSTNADRYNATRCSGNAITSVAAPEVYDAVTQARITCARGALCPAGDVCTTTGACLAPTGPGANPQCLANKVTYAGLPVSPRRVPQVHATAPNFDKRAYNQHLYKQVGAAGGYQFNAFGIPFQVTGAYYRIHTNHSLAPGSDAGAPPTCQQPDIADQIGCLVQASPCSIGFGGSATPVRTGAAALKVHLLDPTPSCIQSLGYPLWTKLYLNSVAGFAQVTGQELALVQCAADPNVMSTSLVDNSLIPLANVIPYCEDFNEQALCGQSSNNNTCSASGLPTSPPITTCGNGMLEPYEECDNGVANVNGGAPGTCSLICRGN